MNRVVIVNETKEKIIPMPELRKGQIAVITTSGHNKGKIVMGVFHDGPRRDSRRPHTVCLVTGDTWSGDTSLAVKILPTNTQIEITTEAPF